MRVLHLLTLAVGAASTALNPLARHNIKRPSTLLSDAAVVPAPLRASGNPIKPFSISNLSTQSFLASGTTYNQSLSCMPMPLHRIPYNIQIP